MILVLINCGSTKGYEGKARPIAELATLHSKTKKFSKKHEQLGICEVNGILVGNYLMGWPKKVYIAEGRNLIKVQYSRNDDPNGTVMVPAGVVGGAIAGAVYSTANYYGKERIYKTIDLEAESGNFYAIDFKVVLTNIDKELLVWITNIATDEIVGGSDSLTYDEELFDDPESLILEEVEIIIEK